MKVFLVCQWVQVSPLTGRNLSEKLDYDFYTDKLIEKAERRKLKIFLNKMVKIIFVKKNQKP